RRKQHETHSCSCPFPGAPVGQIRASYAGPTDAQNSASALVWREVLYRCRSLGSASKAGACAGLSSCWWKLSALLKSATSPSSPVRLITELGDSGHLPVFSHSRLPDLSIRTHPCRAPS